jgi:hypothetical protein
MPPTAPVPRCVPLERRSGGWPHLRGWSGPHAMCRDICSIEGIRGTRCGIGWQRRHSLFHSAILNASGRSIDVSGQCIQLRLYVSPMNCRSGGSPTAMRLSWHNGACHRRRIAERWLHRRPITLGGKHVLTMS